MREALVVVGLLVLAFALRSCKGNLLKKLGAITLLGASFSLFYFVSGNLIVGFLGASIWLLLPWIELLTTVRHLRMPLENNLGHAPMPNPAFFPNAAEATATIEDAGFDHVSDCSWEWSGMKQHFRLFWHPEERAVASVCLCEQEDVAFAFLSITSKDTSGNTWRTTNFPFAPTLRCLPNLKWNQVPCEKSCFLQILEDHRQFLEKKKTMISDLLLPDPEMIEAQIEAEMRAQVEHNLDSGIIRLTYDGNFKYSTKGLIFLWGQSIRDMIRLC